MCVASNTVSDITEYIIYYNQLTILHRKAADDVLEKNALCLIESRRCLYKNYLSERSCENKRNVKIVEKELKKGPGMCEVDAKD